MIAHAQKCAGSVAPRVRADQVPELAQEPPASFSAAVIRFVDDQMAFMQSRPGNYLTMHIGPLLPQHEDLWKAILPGQRQHLQTWTKNYQLLLDGLGLVPKPEWSASRAALVLQAMLDGFLLRYRIMPDEFTSAATWEGASVFADGVIAFMLGAIDWERSGEMGREVLDGVVGGAAIEDE